MAQNAKDKDSTYGTQRRRIEKLMEDPEKPVRLPESSACKTSKYEPPDFVRNVMGSSAGAGSGEFHVYRHLRRKEMSRLKEMEEMSISEKLDAEYKVRLLETKRKAEERTSKKRLKREKKKKAKQAVNKSSKDIQS